jgi:Rieske Fe-S protein
MVSSLFPPHKIDELADMAPGEAKVVRYDRHVAAIYKDEAHQIHAIDSKCTHMNCTIAWNTVEKSWDCPCHGSRFTCDGVVLNAPAQKDLDIVNIEEQINAPAYK